MAQALYLDPASQESIWDSTTALFGDVTFNCNAQVIASSHAAHNGNAFRYIFAVPPALHGDDVPYSFYCYGNSLTDYLVANGSTAAVIQRIITSVATSDMP